MNQGFTFTSSTSSLPLTEKFSFSAKERDTETGLSYFGARYYSSDLSIWLSVDPMSGKYPSLSPYTYCRNNPIIWIDPYGEKSWPIESKYGEGKRCIISGMRRNDHKTRHGGLDIVHRTPRGKHLSGGTITATHSGIVTQSGFSKTAGNWVQITNGNIRTTYMHMESAPTQKIGDWVSENDVLGRIGCTGRSFDPHLHYQIEILNNDSGNWEKYNPVVEGYEEVTYKMDVHLFDPQNYIDVRDKEKLFNEIPYQIEDVIIKADYNEKNGIENEIDSN